MLRGPFSALHGNSSGGVVQVWSRDGAPGEPWQLRAAAGSHGDTALSSRMAGGSDRAGYSLALSRVDNDGWRDHSAAQRTVANLKLGLDLADGHRLEVVANAVDIPHAQDPLGLDAGQVRDNPRQAVAAADQFNTRKRVDQQQLGAIYTGRGGGAGSLRLAAYAGHRGVEQYLPVPVAAQAAPGHAGGVIDLDSGYHGADLRWSWQGSLAGHPLEASIGLNADRQRQRRLGFENFVDGRLGVRGALRRDEHNRAGNTDAYAQAWWRPDDRWALLAGARHSQVLYSSHDHYIMPGNPDDSGRVRYRNTAPVAGISFAPDPSWRLFASAGRGFETPTFNELSYRADGGAGLAFGLAPATSDHAELGARWRPRPGVQLEAALFRADTANELAVARNAGGRSSYRNAGRTRRQGVELGASLALADAWTLELAATGLDARFRDTLLVCAGAGCTVPDTPLPAGTRLPGVPRQQAFARLEWRHGQWSAALEGEAMGRVGADDLGAHAAAGFGLLHLEASRDVTLSGGRLRAFARIDNLLDRSYVGSVIVNEGNGRYYEPGAGRGATLGLAWDWTVRSHGRR